MIQVIIDDKTYQIPLDQFRRIVVCAETQLRRCKQMEGSMFPANDKQTLDLIHKLQFKHKELI